MTKTNATYIRAQGAHSAEWLAERDRRAAERREALEARQAAFRAEHPELADAIAATMRKRGRR